MNTATTILVITDGTTAAAFRGGPELHGTAATTRPPSFSIAEALEAMETPPKKRGRYWESPKGYRGKRH